MCLPGSGSAKFALICFYCVAASEGRAQLTPSQIGREVAIPSHLQDGKEYQLSATQLIAFGEKLFTARWTIHDLPLPRLKPDPNGIVWVPAFTDLNLHDICAGPNDPNAEPLDQNQAIGSSAFLQRNTKFITRTLWGTANSGCFMHDGKFTTMREAVLAHSGEALASRKAFEALSAYESDSIIEFLKTLQAFSRGTTASVVTEDHKSGVRADHIESRVQM